MNRSLADFFAMGGYAQYVWPSYIVAMGAIVLTSLSAIRLLASTLTAVRQSIEETAVDDKEGGA